MQKEYTATLKDVARISGVSLSTASRVLSNNNYPVSQEIRQRVLTVAKEIQYVPNLNRGYLKNNYSDSIAVIVPTLQNPFYNQVISGIESAAASTSYDIRIFSSHRSMQKERKIISELLSNRIMSLIIISIDEQPDALENYISYGGKVALLEADFTLKNCISAEIDWAEAATIAVSHLYELGHKNIAFITSPMSKIYRRAIKDAITSFMQSKKLQFTDKDIFSDPKESELDTDLYEFNLGKILTNRLLASKKKYTAIIAINDITAFGCINALTHNGLSVPDDISIIGFDNIIYSEMLSPPLTTVELPSNNMGYLACQMLISINRDEQEIAACSFKLPVTLRFRESTAKI